MLIHELTTAECHEVLRRSHLARVACCRDDHPYIVPISFDFDGEHLYSFATLGQKIVWMRENPNVCVEVYEIEDRFHWTTVLVFGRYEELRSPVEHESAREQCTRAASSSGTSGGSRRPPRPGRSSTTCRSSTASSLSRITGRRADRPAL